MRNVAPPLCCGRADRVYLLPQKSTEPMLEELPQIEKIFVYNRDIVVKRLPPVDTNPGRGKRSAITEFSFNSRRNLAFTAANTDIVFTYMVTLTYPRVFPNRGKDVKRNLKAFIQYMRRVDQGVSYLWFLEFQKRGAPHIHILYRMVSSQLEKTAVSQRWYEIVNSGDNNHLLAGTRVEKLRKPDGAARYAVKYAMKTKQKQVPEDYQDVGTFWNCSHDVRPKVKKIYRIKNEDDLRLYLMRWSQEVSNGRFGYKILYGAAEYLERARGEK